MVNITKIRNTFGRGLAGFVKGVGSLGFYAWKSCEWASFRLHKWATKND